MHRSPWQGYNQARAQKTKTFSILLCKKERKIRMPANDIKQLCRSACKTKEYWNISKWLDTTSPKIRAVCMTDLSERRTTNKDLFRRDLLISESPQIIPRIVLHPTRRVLKQHNVWNRGTKTFSRNNSWESLNYIQHGTLSQSLW